MQSKKISDKIAAELRIAAEIASVRSTLEPEQVETSPPPGKKVAPPKKIRYVGKPKHTYHRCIVFSWEVDEPKRFWWIKVGKETGTNPNYFNRAPLNVWRRVKRWTMFKIDKDLPPGVGKLYSIFAKLEQGETVIRPIAEPELYEHLLQESTTGRPATWRKS